MIKEYLKKVALAKRIALIQTEIINFYVIPDKAMQSYLVLHNLQINVCNKKTAMLLYSTSNEQQNEQKYICVYFSKKLVFLTTFTVKEFFYVTDEFILC